jgi:hypothetical protein
MPQTHHHRPRRFYEAPEDAIEPMTTERRRYYLTRQLEHERRGEWDDANLLNQWLVGVFATFEDLLDDNLPALRRHFLRRLCKAGVI